MKRITLNPITNHNNSQKYLAPATFILYLSSAALSIMFICGIVLRLLPESICDPSQTAECAYDLLSVSFRVIALSAVFITIAAVLDARYPLDSE